MLRPLYNWTMRLAGHRHALWALAGIAFIESSVFPIPPDVLLIPMILAAGVSDDRRIGRSERTRPPVAWASTDRLIPESSATLTPPRLASPLAKREYSWKPSAGRS